MSVGKNLSSVFIRGLLVFLPFMLSVYVFWAFFKAIETAVEKMILFLLPAHFYFPGLGIIVTFLFILFLGFICYFSFTKQIKEWMEYPFKKIPGLKNLYSIFVEIVAYFSKGDDQTGQKKKVVLVKIPNIDVHVIGFITQEDAKSLPGELKEMDKVAVYMPLSYQMGGLTAFLPRSWLTEVNMDFESALKGAVTGWIFDSSKK